MITCEQLANFLKQNGVITSEQILYDAIIAMR